MLKQTTDTPAYMMCVEMPSVWVHWPLYWTSAALETPKTSPRLHATIKTILVVNRSILDWYLITRVRDRQRSKESKVMKNTETMTVVQNMLCLIQQNISLLTKMSVNARQWRRKQSAPRMESDTVLLSMRSLIWRGSLLHLWRMMKRKMFSTSDRKPTPLSVSSINFSALSLLTLFLWSIML